MQGKCAAVGAGPDAEQDTMEAILWDFVREREREHDCRPFKRYGSHLHPWPVMVAGANPGGDWCSHAAGGAAPEAWRA
jgi:hypothetical protein